MKLILLGAPGAGKGTQAELIARELSIPTISTGNILRAAVKSGTPFGLQVKALIDKGLFVPDDVVIDIVKERLAEPDCANGYILDGMPRTLAQAEALEENGIQIDIALQIDLADEIIEKRMTGRRTCIKCGATYHVEAFPSKVEGICDKCGTELIVRQDDMPETVKNRLKIYHMETEPLISYYKERGKLRTVSGIGSVAETNKLVKEALGIEQS